MLKLTRTEVKHETDAAYSDVFVFLIKDIGRFEFTMKFISHNVSTNSIVTVLQGVN